MESSVQKEDNDNSNDDIETRNIDGKCSASRQFFINTHLSSSDALNYEAAASSTAAAD